MSTASVPPDHDLPGLHGPRRPRRIPGCSSDLAGFTALVLAAAVPLAYGLALLMTQLGAHR